MHTTESREVIGVTEFSGSLYHGGYLKGPLDPELPFIDLQFPYRDYLLAVDRSNHPGLDKFNDYSLTLGPGLYTTTQEEARKYALLRGYGDIPIVHTIEVSQARLFDFRNKTNSALNGQIPLGIAEMWQEYFNNNEHTVREFFTGTSGGFDKQISRNFNSYKGHLRDFIDRVKTGRDFQPETYKPLGFGESDTTIFGANRFLKRDKSIRDLLRTINWDMDWTHSWFGGLWVRFVEDQLGCDGIVAMEGGDAADFQDAPSTVIYNLAVVTSQTTEILTA